MIYGYSNKTVNEYGLMEMKEVTFAITAKELRQLGQFMIDMAHVMETGGFETCSHRHITTVHPEWNQSGALADVVVMLPEAPPAEPLR